MLNGYLSSGSDMFFGGDQIAIPLLRMEKVNPNTDRAGGIVKCLRHRTRRCRDGLGGRVLALQGYPKADEGQGTQVILQRSNEVHYFLHLWAHPHTSDSPSWMMETCPQSTDGSSWHSLWWRALGELTCTGIPADGEEHEWVLRWLHWDRVPGLSRVSGTLLLDLSERHKINKPPTWDKSLPDLPCSHTSA